MTMAKWSFASNSDSSPSVVSGRTCEEEGEGGKERKGRRVRVRESEGEEGRERGREGEERKERKGRRVRVREEGGEEEAGGEFLCMHLILRTLQPCT